MKASPDINDTLRNEGPDAVRQRHDRAKKYSRPNGKDNTQTATNITLDDFVAYLPAHGYIFKPTREIWPAASVNAHLPPVGKTTASAWLDANRPVMQMTWAPGEPEEIKNKLVAAGGWIERRGCTVFNLYRPPTIQGQKGDAAPWLNHVQKVFPDDAEHIVKFLAHRVQRPQEKINHALILGGQQGIGKDTILEPVKHAVGPWNFQETSPQQMLGRFNSFLKSVILRVNEARDLGDVDRFAFYDHMKAYTAAPPDVLRVDEKHLREHSVINCCGVIITTNYKMDGIYLPPDDRRHYVAWSQRTEREFSEDYWRRLWKWYEQGGYRIIASYLSNLDLSDFNPKTPPPKTPTFWTIVDANRSPEDAELADVLDNLGSPEAVTLETLVNATTNSATLEWLSDRKNRRSIPHRMERCGYVPVRNETNERGEWRIKRRRQTIYAKSTMSVRDRFLAARQLQLASGED
jgi:hypothetical protein